MSNLLPYNHVRLIRKLYLLKTVSVTIWFLIFMVLLGVVLFIPTLFTINSRFAIAKRQIQTLEEGGALVSPVDVALYEKTTAGLVQSLALPQPKAPTEYIAVLTETLTPNVALTGFDVSDSEERVMVRTSGIAQTRENLQSYLGALEKRPEVVLVDNPISNYIGSRDIEFSVVVTFTKK